MQHTLFSHWELLPYWCLVWNDNRGCVAETVGDSYDSTE
jgi:hypothetical protein